VKYDQKCLLVFVYPLFLSDFNQTQIFSTNFRKYSNITFSKNPSTGSRVVPCGRTDKKTDRQTDITKLTVTFRKFTNAPKTVHLYICIFRTTAIASLNVIKWSVFLVEANFILWQVGTEQHAENFVNFLSHPIKLLRYSSKLGYGRYFPELWQHTRTHTHTHIFIYIWR
jgi:hypothetical protein